MLFFLKLTCMGGTINIINPTLMAGATDIDPKDPDPKDPDPKDPKDPKDPDPKDPKDPDPKDPKDPDPKKPETVPHAKFHSERERRKAAEDKLAKIEADAEAKAEEAAKKKGKYKELYESEKEKNTTLDKDNKSLTERITGIEEASQTRISESLKSIKKDDDREFAEKLLKGKSISDQEALLPGILTKFSLPSDVNKGVGGDGSDHKDDVKAARQKAKEENNPALAIKHAKEVE